MEPDIEGAEGYAGVTRSTVSRGKETEGTREGRSTGGAEVEQVRGEAMVLWSNFLGDVISVYTVYIYIYFMD